MLSSGFAKLISVVSDRLTVFYQTVVKSVGYSGQVITNITVIQRTSQVGLECNGYDILPSEDLPDWYSLQDSKRWQKTELVFIAPIFIEATDWGEVLALTGASYLQGIDEEYDGDTRGTYGTDTCGQAFTYSLVEKYHSIPSFEPPNPQTPIFPSHYPSGYADSWNKTWTYRRIYSQHTWNIDPDDLCLQNTNGNDFGYGYFFLPKNITAGTLNDWQGGVNVTSMSLAENLALGWHYWYKEQNETLQDYITLESSEMGTCHGLAKLPYLRDSRRSVGLDNFVITAFNISGVATDMVGTVWPDRVAIGAYDVDIHSDYGMPCTYPEYMLNMSKYQVLPYFIPFRAMTNKDIGNMLVAGKTMAQSFLANAALRVHPVEWASGSAAGAAAAFMALNSIFTTSAALDHISQIQERTSIYTPLNWNLSGIIYPEINVSSCCNL